MKYLRSSGTGILTAFLMAGCAGPDLDTLVPAFRGELARLAREAESVDRIAVTGLDGWVFFGPELRHVSLGRFWGADATTVSRSRRPDDADPLPAILDVKRQLDQLGVELLLVPVPPKAVVFPEKISDGLQIPIPVPRLDPAHQEFFDRLRAEGLDVLDLTKLFIAERFHPEGPLYCHTDTHWSGSGCVVAASAIAAEVRDRPWYDELETRRFGAAWYSTAIVGDLTQEGGMPAPREEVRLRGIVTRTERGPAPVAADPDSPIVLLGDSHNLVFHAGGDMHATGAGLPDQLAFELGLGLDVVAVRGSGATPARVNLLRRAQSAPGYWDRKRLVIWCFAARELTESDGWRLVPIR
jgi:alginate O-acetyltransferase complex protein AlgJ